MSWTFSTITLAGAAVFACLAAAPAQAEMRKAVFSFEQAELEDDAGARAVYKRLQMSAKHACKASSPLLRRDQMRCQRELEARLIAQTSSPVLLALHQGSADHARVASAD